MKRPRREAVGGEVALMAVITKAMGAFLILVVIMLPHYVLSVSNSKTADQAQERADNASKTANEISDTLKKGRLTDQEIDELLRKIEELKKELAQLQDEIAQLKNELNQALAEVERLKKAKEELEAEVARLKKELEELKRSTRPSTMVVASWANCPGSDFDLYVWSDAKEQPTGSEKSASQPPVSRKVQGPYWPGEAKSKLSSGGFRESGSIWWRTPESAEKETLFVWVKLLDPIHTRKSRGRECTVDIVATSSRGETVESAFFARDQWPFGPPLVLERGADGRLSSKSFDYDVTRKLTGELFASACDGLLCFANAEPVPEADLDKLKKAFVAFVAETRPGKDGLVGALFDRMASGATTVADGYLWLKPLLAYLPKGALPSATSEELAAAKELLAEKGAPPEVESDYVAALSDGRLDYGSLSLTLNRIADAKAGTKARSSSELPSTLPQPPPPPKPPEPDIMSEPPH